jgi:hypothetical protein
LKKICRLFSLYVHNVRSSILNTIIDARGSISFIYIEEICTQHRKKVNFDRLQASSINQLKLWKIKNRSSRQTQKNIRVDLARIAVSMSDCHLFDCAYITNGYSLIFFYNQHPDRHQTCMPVQTDRFQRKNEQCMFSLLWMCDRLLEWKHDSIIYVNTKRILSFDWFQW